MTSKEIKKIIAQGESISIEFKTSEFELSKNTFETICAFLNRGGGMIFLGVKDDGTIQGIIESAVQSILDSLVSDFNNPKKLNPTYYLTPQVIIVDGKTIIYIKIPESSQVHQTAGKIFDRNEDGDFNITNNYELVKQLYQRKSNVFTENTIYPYLQYSDFRADLINKVRVIASNSRPNHPWSSMTNEEILKSARLYQTNFKTNESGYTLAAALIFGKDEVLQSILPAYKTDALVRIVNTDRYDDRDEVRTNLIESYDRLMAFVQKHLPDPFYLEGDQRQSLREMIFREAITNTLIHREFTNAFPARLIIEKDQVTIENWNLPMKHGLISPELFYTHPKNPNILQLFKEIRYADELGSGVRNIFKYTKIYSGGKMPVIKEMDTFKITVPYVGKKEVVGEGTIVKTDSVIEDIIDEAIMGLSKPTKDRLVALIENIFLQPGIKAVELQSKFQVSERTIFEDLHRLKKYIEYVGSKKTGGYQLLNRIIMQINDKTAG